MLQLSQKISDDVNKYLCKVKGKRSKVKGQRPKVKGQRAMCKGQWAKGKGKWLLALWCNHFYKITNIPCKASNGWVWEIYLSFTRSFLEVLLTFVIFFLYVCLL